MSEEYKISFWGLAKDADKERVHKRERDIAFLKGFFKFWAVPMLVAAGIGFYVSLSIVPLVISALVAAGLMPWLALMLGISIGFALMLGAVAVPLSRFLETFVIIRFFNFKMPIKDRHPPLVFFWYLFALLAGIAFGIYLATLIAPVVIHALTALGLGYGWAFLVGITTSLVLIAITIDLLAIPATVYKALDNFGYQGFLLFRNLKIGGFSYIVAAIVGVGFGTYLSTVAAPLLISTLVGLPGINMAIAVFIAVAASLALIAGFARVFSAVGMLLAGLISRIVLAKQESDLKKNNTLEPIKVEMAKTNILQAVVLGGPLTELTLFVQSNDKPSEGPTPLIGGGKVGNKA